MTQFRPKPIPVRMQIPHEIFWNRPIEEAICLGGMVSPATQDANLVLHLNHHNGLLPHSKFSYVPHQGLKSAGIGVEILLGQGGKNLQRTAIRRDRATKALGFLLHPVRRIA